MMDKITEHVTKHIRFYLVVLICSLFLVVLVNVFRPLVVNRPPAVVLKNPLTTPEGVVVGETQITQLEKFGDIKSTKEANGLKYYTFPLNTEVAVEGTKIVYVKHYATADEKAALVKRLPDFGNPDMQLYYWEDWYKTNVYLDDGVAIVYSSGYEVTTAKAIYEVRYFVPTTNRDEFMTKWGSGILQTPPPTPGQGRPPSRN